MTDKEAFLAWMHTLHADRAKAAALWAQFEKADPQGTAWWFAQFAPEYEADRQTKTAAVPLPIGELPKVEWEKATRVGMLEEPLIA